MQNKCVLYNRNCINCGECEKCDLNADKICDNCMKCVIGNNDFISVNAVINEKNKNHE